MKLFVYFGLLLSSFYLIASETISWQYRNGKTMEPFFAPSLDTAKKWAAEHYKNKNGIIKFEFAIWKSQDGHKVMITPVYVGDTIVIDGNMCVHTNKEHKYVKAKQCMAP